MGDLVELDLELSVQEIRDVLNETSLDEILDGIHAPDFPNRRGYYQYLHSGQIFFPCDPRPEEIFIRDIARGLSSQSRFYGQTKARLTVAEHCYLCAILAPPELALECLLHDATEAYIGDMIRPLKKIPIFADLYLRIEEQIMRAVAERYKLKHPLPTEVFKIDEIVGLTEVAKNINTVQKGDDPMYRPPITYLIDDKHTQIGTFALYLWEPKLAEDMFLHLFYKLATERGVAGN